MMKRLFIVAMMVFAFQGVCTAGPGRFEQLLAEGDAHDARRESKEAVECYLAADALSSNNAEVLWRISKQYCNMMLDGVSKKDRETLVSRALGYATRAVEADSTNAKAHLALAICYGKKLPFCDNATKINYSKLIKAEAEKAIQLDPKNDLGYHMLGRWNFEVASMGFFTKEMIRMAYGGLPPASHQNAVDCYQKAIALAPGRIIHHFSLAKAYRALGKTRDWNSELELCLKLTPTDKDDAAVQADAVRILKKSSRGAKDGDGGP
jgi:tetratricopeptide (TPR) repeat protein